MIRILKICVFATMWLMPSTSTHLPLVLDMFKLNLKYPIIWLICLLRCIKFELNWIGIERKWIELELNWKILNPIWIGIELNWKILNPTWIGIELNWKKWIDPSPDSWWPGITCTADDLAPHIQLMTWHHMYSWWPDTACTADDLTPHLQLLTWHHLYSWWPGTTCTADDLASHGPWINYSNYCHSQLDPKEQSSVEFQSKYNNFHSKKRHFKMSSAKLWP